MSNTFLSEGANKFPGGLRPPWLQPCVHSSSIYSDTYHITARQSAMIDLELHRLASLPSVKCAWRWLTDFLLHHPIPACLQGKLCFQQIFLAVDSRPPTYCKNHNWNCLFLRAAVTTLIVFPNTEKGMSYKIKLVVRFALWHRI